MQLLRKLLLTGILLYSLNVYAQTGKPFHFNGNISATNNGMSFIPTFTLGKPAAILEFSMGRRLSFDPQLRFALTGKPWSFIFWWRYKIINKEKWTVQTGAHPGFLFKTASTTVNGVTRSRMLMDRYFAGEITPVYHFTAKLAVGVYYLYSHGLNEDAVDNTHFLTLNATIGQLPVGKNGFVKCSPQLYYLRMDNRQGYYSSAVFTAGLRNKPLSLSVVMNKKIHSAITAGKPFTWNISLNWSFHRQFRPV